MLTKKKSKSQTKKVENETDDVLSDLHLLADEAGSTRKMGLYGQLDPEKGELCVHTLLHLHERRMKNVPRPLTEAQKKKLKKLQQENSEEVQVEFKFDSVAQPIEFYICTPGGSASDMFALYDVMRLVRKDCDIETIGMGQVMSAGTLLLASGTKGKRKIGKHCRVMVHQVSAGTSGAHHEMINEIAEIQHTQEQYIRCLAAETKMSETYIRKLFEKKVNIYMSAEEAVKNGLADIII